MLRKGTTPPLLLLYRREDTTTTRLHTNHTNFCRRKLVQNTKNTVTQWQQSSKGIRGRSSPPVTLMRTVVLSIMSSRTSLRSEDFLGPGNGTTH